MLWSRLAQCWWAFLATLLLMPCMAQAHVALDSPNGGETLVGGETFLIEWQPLVQHGPVDWDLWYSTTSSAGPWIDIASNLLIGSDSPHSFEWTVPNGNYAETWVRVRQDNIDTDYYDDESDASFSINAAVLSGDHNDNGVVDAADYNVWLDNLGSSVVLPGDTTPGLITQADYVLWKTHFGMGAGSGSAIASTIPEPTAGLILLLGMATILFRRHAFVA